MTIKLAARADGKVVVYFCETDDYEVAMAAVGDALTDQGVKNIVVLAQVKPKIIVELAAA
jgi:hypothetical protein